MDLPCGGGQHWSGETGAGRMAPPHTTQSLTPPVSTLTSTSQALLPDSSTGHEFHRADREPGDGATAFPQADAIRRGVLSPGKVTSVGCVGRGLSIGTQLSPWSHTTQSLLTQLRSSPSRPPSTEAQGEWLQTRWCALAL